MGREFAGRLRAGGEGPADAPFTCSTAEAFDVSTKVIGPARTRRTVATPSSVPTSRPKLSSTLPSGPPAVPTTESTRPVSPIGRSQSFSAFPGRQAVIAFPGHAGRCWPLCVRQG